MGGGEGGVIMILDLVAVYKTYLRSQAFLFTDFILMYFVRGLN